MGAAVERALFYLPPIIVRRMAWRIPIERASTDPSSISSPSVGGGDQVLSNLRALTEHRLILTFQARLPPPHWRVA
jgi:hypothetical protein